MSSTLQLEMEPVHGRKVHGRKWNLQNYQIVHLKQAVNPVPDRHQDQSLVKPRNVKSMNMIISVNSTNQFLRMLLHWKDPLRSHRNGSLWSHLISQLPLQYNRLEATNHTSHAEQRMSSIWWMRGLIRLRQRKRKVITSADITRVSMCPSIENQKLTCIVFYSFAILMCNNNVDWGTGIVQKFIINKADNLKRKSNLKPKTDLNKKQISILKHQKTRIMEFGIS